MKVLLINAPFREKFSRSQRSPAVIKSGTMYYPYWLASATAVLEQTGHEVSLIDASAQGLKDKDVLCLAESFKPELTVIDTSTPSIQNDINFAVNLTTHYPKTHICLVGTHASACPEKTIESTDCIDFIIKGEYDFTLKELASKMDNGEDVSEIPGLYSRTNDERIQFGGERPLIENLDQLPFSSPIYKKHLNIKDYYFSLSMYPMIMLITGRGCPSQCIYCIYPQTLHGHGYRTRSPENIVKEILYIQKELPEIREITFEDDTFAANRLHTRELCLLMIESKVRLPWFANLRVNTDFETLKIMKQAGLRNCAVGFESGNDELLRTMKKGSTVERGFQFKKDCDQLGINVHGCFMVGFPGETKEMMEATFQYAKSLQCDSAQFYPVFIYPGTEAYDWVKSNGYLHAKSYDEWLTEEGYHQPVYSLPALSSEEMVEFCERAYRRYHFGWGYLLRKIIQGIKTPKEGVRTFKSGANYLNYLFKNALAIR